MAARVALLAAVTLLNCNVGGWRTLIVASKGKGNVVLRPNKAHQYPLNPSMQPQAPQAEVDADDFVLLPLALHVLLKFLPTEIRNDFASRVALR